MAHQPVDNGNTVTVTKKVPVIFSQTVGTFHTTLRPGTPITLGAIIGSITGLGISHDVTADIGGTLSVLLVHDGEPVQFGQPIGIIVPPGSSEPPTPVVTNSHVGAARPVASAPDPTLRDITALLAGTFYAAPAPDAPPYVSLQSHVAVDQPVCIIEAMKMFNEIPAPCSGTIMEILVTNGTLVEKDQVLFRIKADSA
ncbi:MAG: hypothetical protein HZC01_00545 [Candidatus Kerfeldbacteria bacterium]|nr:hypothetical protein [Candidatus Kerfeldbacteria bacterium]